MEADSVSRTSVCIGHAKTRHAGNGPDSAATGPGRTHHDRIEDLDVLPGNPFWCGGAYRPAYPATERFGWCANAVASCRPGTSMSSWSTCMLKHLPALAPYRPTLNVAPQAWIRWPVLCCGPAMLLGVLQLRIGMAPGTYSTFRME